MIPWLRRACVLVALATTIAVAACGGVSTRGGSTADDTAPAATAPASPERDPAARGAYGVGVTKMLFERPSSSGAQEPRKLDTWIWYPTGDAASAAAINDAAPASGRFPIVVFSHGSNGQPEFYRFFEEHVASWGLVVVAPPHPGNTSADCLPCGSQSIIESARNRPDDVEFVLDRMIALQDDPAQPLGRILDPARTALAGHSFGGWTAVITAKRGRFNAIVAMAPGLPETLLGAAPSVHVPVLILGAGKDELVPPDSVRKLYDALPDAASKVYVSLPDAHHTSFDDRCFGCTDALPEARGQQLTNRYATAFLATYLLGDERYRHYLSEDVGTEAVVVR